MSSGNLKGSWYFLSFTTVKRKKATFILNTVDILGYLHSKAEGRKDKS